ncbi:MAG: hypothetical protein ACYC7E_19435 [Armatimonadota bacterium]
MAKLKDMKELLYTDAYYPVEIERYLDPTMDPPILKWDPVLGYFHLNQSLKDGIDDARTASTMDPKYFNRTMINYADQPCRITTYGDSYTLCAQVGDAETWQETLAGHLREPIRNYGVGGYGVYQAYRRAMRMEAIKEIASEYLILNIWDDDYKRNLDAARWIRVGWMVRDLPRGLKDGYPVHGFPWAHLRYDVDNGAWVEREGMCEKIEDLRKLVGKDNFYNAFKDDPVAQLYCLTEGGEAPVEPQEKLAEAFGIKVDLRNPKTRQADARKLHIAYGIRSTMYTVDKFRTWCQANNRKFMVLLSYDVPTVQAFCKGKPRFDEEFVEFLDRENYLYVDSLTKFRDEYKQFRGTIDEFCNKYYVSRAGAQVFGHFNPLGYFWFAHAIRKDIVNWLDPKPLTYRD